LIEEAGPGVKNKASTKFIERIAMDGRGLGKRAKQ
jgi:hypothetical protein